ncbi:hypothetical protein B566_EDAN007335 [Ephemera danica]|nr:hypothetical protein B566_EDAN007335 [Ephemera danica]
MELIASTTAILLLLLALQGGEARVDEAHDNEDKAHQHHEKPRHHHKWDYTKQGQTAWRDLHEECGGEGQSPIRVSTRHAKTATFPALEMVGYHNPLPSPITLTNNGHSVSLSPSENGDLPYIFGGPLHDDFELVSLHFHWGRHNNRGSEHIINSIRYALELHIIHRNRKYATLAEALKHADGLAVVAFFFQAGERHNMRLDTLLRSLPLVRHAGDEAKLERPLPLAWLQPRDIDTFYSYKGSLTTPPCSEAVTWLLFPHALHVSFDQMDLFRRLSAGDEPLVDNYRMPQPLNSRLIYVHRLRGILHSNTTMPHAKHTHHTHETHEDSKEQEDTEVQN